MEFYTITVDNAAMFNYIKKIKSLECIIFPWTKIYLDLTHTCNICI